MKLTSILTAASLLAAAAMPSFAQTAPAAPAAAQPAAPATNAFANVPVVQQVDSQLVAQGYSITNVVQAANGSYTITAVSATGVTRTITINPATGAVVDSLNAGVGAGVGEGMEAREGNERGGEGNERGGNTERDGGGSDD